MLGVTLQWTSIWKRGGGGVEILLVSSCYRNWNKLWPDFPMFVVFFCCLVVRMLYAMPTQALTTT